MAYMVELLLAITLLVIAIILLKTPLPKNGSRANHVHSSLEE